MAIRIKHKDWGDGYLEAVPGSPHWTWKATGAEAEEWARIANAVAMCYSYSPGDGQPGFLLAQKVIREIPGADVELPPLQKDPPGTVY